MTKDRTYLPTLAPSRCNVDCTQRQCTDRWRSWGAGSQAWLQTVSGGLRRGNRRAGSHGAASRVNRRGPFPNYLARTRKPDELSTVWKPAPSKRPILRSLRGHTIGVYARIPGDPVRLHSTGSANLRPSDVQSARGTPAVHREQSGRGRTTPRPLREGRTGAAASATAPIGAWTMPEMPNARARGGEVLL